MIRQKFSPCSECGDERGRKYRGVKGPKCLRHAPSKVKKATHDDPAVAQQARAMGCAVAGMVGRKDGKSWLHICDGPIDAHHITSRGAGGKDAGNLVGLCRRAHDQLHQWGAKSFPLAYNIDLWEKAV
jgi:hypothetical protein